MLFDCGDEIAPFDADAVATKAGELIAKVTSHQPKGVIEHLARILLTKAS